jgi:hypothetical protein
MFQDFWGGAGPTELSQLGATILGISASCATCRCLVVLELCGILSSRLLSGSAEPTFHGLAVGRILGISFAGMINRALLG